VVAGLIYPLGLIRISRVLTLLRKLVGGHWLVRVEHWALGLADEAATVARLLSKGLAAILGAKVLRDGVALRLPVGMSFKIEVLLST